MERLRAASNDMMVDGENTGAHYRVHSKQFPGAHFVIPQYPIATLLFHGQPPPIEYVDTNRKIIGVPSRV